MMKNYKINSITNIDSIFGTKTLTNKQKETLEALGFNYKEFYNVYEKSYCYDSPYGWIDMMIYPSEKYLRFYQRGAGRPFLPVELEETTKEHYKTLMKVLALDIKELKNAKILS